MKKQNFFGTVSIIKRLNNSATGNPRVLAEVLTDSGELLTIKTANNSPAGYVLISGSVGKVFQFVGHFTREYFIVDYIK